MSSLLNSSSVAYFSVSIIVFAFVTVGSFFALKNEADRIRREKEARLGDQTNI